MQQPDKLDNRMKQYENKVDSKLVIKAYEYFIIRLDGRSFRSFCKYFKKPFDIVFIKAMALTTQDLIQKFEAQTGYTHSDEITLIFNAKCSEYEYEESQAEAQSGDQLKEQTEEPPDEQIKNKPEKQPLTQHMFNGRIQKLVSLISSYCSVKFNYHLEKLITPVASQYDAHFVDLINRHEQMFDGRILIFKEDEKHEILNHQIWRSVYDCLRNCISTFGRAVCGSNELLNKNSIEIIELMKEKNNFDFSSQVPLFVKHGLYCKKILVNKQIRGVNVNRSEYVFKQYRVHFTTDNLNILLSKYWNNNDDWGGPVYLNNLHVPSPLL